jgi:lysophospholipase L1-like esterase
MIRLLTLSLLVLALSTPPPPVTTFHTWPGSRVIAAVGDSWVRNDYITGPLRTRLQADLHAFGINGATTAIYLAQTQWTDDLRTLHPDLVILLLGTNDQREILPRQLRANMSQMIARVRAAVPGVDVLVVAPGDNGVPRRLSMPWYASALKAAAGERRALFFDSASVLGTFAEATAAGLMQGRAHLNAEGGKVVGEAVYEILTASPETR